MVKLTNLRPDLQTIAEILVGSRLRVRLRPIHRNRLEASICCVAPAIGTPTEDTWVELVYGMDEMGHKYAFAPGVPNTQWLLTTWTDAVLIIPSVCVAVGRVGFV